MPSKKRFTFFISTTILSAFVLLIFGVFYINNFIGKKTFFSESEKYSIYENIIKNNSFNSKNNTDTLSAKEVGAMARDLATGSSTLLPFPNIYNENSSTTEK